MNALPAPVSRPSGDRAVGTSPRDIAHFTRHRASSYGMLPCARSRPPPVRSRRLFRKQPGAAHGQHKSHLHAFRKANGENSHGSGCIYRASRGGQRCLRKAVCMQGGLSASGDSAAPKSSPSVGRLRQLVYRSSLCTYQCADLLTSRVTVVCWLYEASTEPRRRLASLLLTAESSLRPCVAEVLTCRYRRGGQVLAAVGPAGAAADNTIILCACVIEELPLRPGCNLPGALCLAGR